MRQCNITDAKTVIYVFHLGMKKEITDFMRVGIEDESRRYFEGHDT